MGRFTQLVYRAYIIRDGIRWACTTHVPAPIAIACSARPSHQRLNEDMRTPLERLSPPSIEARIRPLTALHHSNLQQVRLAHVHRVSG